MRHLKKHSQQALSKGKLLSEYKIYDGEELVMEGRLGLDESDCVRILDGYEKSKEYVGYYNDGKFHGEGCEYDWYGEKYREGVFEQGKLYKGVEYNWIVKFDNQEWIVRKGTLEEYLKKRENERQ